MSYRDIRLPEDLKAEFGAWSKDLGSTPSEQARLILTDYAAGEADVAPTSGEATLRIWVDDPVFEQSKARAKAEGTNVSQVLRRAIGEILAGE